jgi:hypothetical protein
MINMAIIPTIPITGAIFVTILVRTDGQPAVLCPEIIPWLITIANTLIKPTTRAPITEPIIFILYL